jgi:hypothetical protein
LLDILADQTAVWTRREAASEDAIRALTAWCGFNLPNEYLTFLRYSNGGEGPLCIEPWWFQLCRAEEVIAYNQGYNVDRFVPAYFAIGSSGAADMLAIRKKDGSPCPIYMVPFMVTTEDNAVQISYDFELFAMAMGRGGGVAQSQTGL